MIQHISKILSVLNFVLLILKFGGYKTDKENNHSVLNINFERILKRLLIFSLFCIVYTNSEGQICTPPLPNALCTAPTTFDKDVTVAVGTTRNWADIISTDPQDITNKIRIKGGGKVIVPNGNVMLKSATAVLNIENIEFIINNGNLQLDVTGSRYLQNGGILRTYGNFQQTSETVVCITGTTIEIGEEQVGGLFNSTGNINTAANWQNDGGYRYLKSNCINVTQDYQLQSTGTGTGINGVDVIINCCIEIGDRGLQHATPTPFGSKDGDDSGSWQNNNTQSIYGTEIVVANGNYQNSIGTMTLCDVDIKVNVTGSLQNNSGSIVGQNVCIGVEDILENSGTWTAAVSSWYSMKQNSTNVPDAGAEKSQTIVLACFTNSCCANLNACTNPTNLIPSSNSAVQVGNTINLGITSTGGTSYSWAGPNGFTSTTQNPIIASATAGMAGTYTVTVFSSGTCTATATVVVIVNAGCVLPKGKVIPIYASCTGIVPNNDGRIVMTSDSDTDKYGVSVGSTYTGANYATANSVAALPFDVLSNVISTGGTYTVRLFNGSDGCFKDTTVKISVPICPFDPAGFIYCENNGQIISGGKITVSGPGTYFITKDGTSGEYQFFTDGTPGIYTMVYTPPSGYILSTTRLPAGILDPTGQPDPYYVGADSDDNTTIDDFSAASNPYYLQFNLAHGDPYILLNNIPLICPTTPCKKPNCGTVTVIKN